MAKRNSLNLPMSTTHAGGIQPSASFFRPSKPSQYSPPATPDIPLNPLPHDEGSVHDSEPDTQFVTLKTIKRSREPLLPGPGPHSASSRNSMSRDPPLSPTKLVRNSVDRVLNMSRGLSFDSVTKSGLRGSKLCDEESQQQRKRYHNSQRDSGRSSFSLAPPSVASLSASSPSPDPHPLSFIPTPPLHDPPLSAVPLINHQKNRPYRRWEQHPSRNRFFLNGRILTGGDSPWAFVASFALLLSIAGCWFATAGVWWWHNVSPAVTIVAAYLTLLTISTMLTTVTTDPGILPRNLDPDPPLSASSPSDGTDRVPMPRDLKVRSDVVRVKYCPTCRIYRPPRSSHCKMCDNCVDGCDHHCQWVNNCIGRRNYSIFFALLMSATITVIYMIITSALHLYYNGQEQHSFKKTLLSPVGIGSAIAFALSIIVIWPIVALLSYHVRLLLLNVTTIEQIRNQAHKSVIPNGSPPPNPFSHGSWRRNVVATLCRPTGLSWLDAREVVTEDRREVNPAFLHNDERVGGEGRTEPAP